MSEHKSRYLYGIIKACEDRSCGFCGIDGQDVYVISENKIGAVASSFPNKKIRPERRYLGAHQDVLKNLMQKEEALLPVSFGIIADDVAAVHKFLQSQHEVLFEELEHLTGKVEMGLRVNWDVPNIFQYFLETHPELYTFKEHVFTATTSKNGQEEKIELGRMFDRMLKIDRESYAEKVIKILTPSCVEIKNNIPRAEKEVMNLACLIRRDVQKEFEACVYKAACLFDDHFAFNYNGPWAPHNFVNMELSL